MLLHPPVLIVVLHSLFTIVLGNEDYDYDEGSYPGGKKPYQSALVSIMQSMAQPNVAGGEMVRAESVPWQVAIFKKQDFHCGGMIIDKHHVLTADHCIDLPSMLGMYTIVAGESYLMCIEGNEQVRGIEKILRKDEGNNPAKKAGIIILKLDKPLEFNGVEYGINRADIVGQTHIFPEKGDEATLTGWGQTSETDPFSTGIRKVTVARAEQNACKNEFSGREVEHMVCFESKTYPYPSGCIGDEGSPLICGFRREVCGIAIHTDSCGKSGKMDMYVNLIPNIPWIYQQTGNNAPEDKYPKHNESFVGTGSCGGYIHANSGILHVSNFIGGQTCTWVLKTKFKFVRIRILNSTLLPTDRFAAGTMCNNCSEIVMDPIRTDLDHNITQGSLVIVQLIGGAGNNFLVGPVRGVKFLFSSSGFPDEMEGFDDIAIWKTHVPGTASFPFNGDPYENNKRIVLIFSPLENGKKNLTMDFTSFDVISNPQAPVCEDDYVEFYYTKWRASQFNQDGIHRKFGRYCNTFPPPADLIYQFGHGWAIFKSDGNTVGKGFEFSYTLKS